MCSAGTPSTAAIGVARLRPVPHQRLRPAPLATGSISVKDPPNPNYISNSLWGVLRGPALGGLLQGEGREQSAWSCSTSLATLPPAGAGRAAYRGQPVEAAVNAR